MGARRRAKRSSHTNKKKNLTEQFVIVEERGKKADPKEVSKDMRRVKGDSEARLFVGKDVLSP